MRPIRLHNRAQNYMRRMPEKRRLQTAAALKEVAALADVTSHPNVKALSGKYQGWYRLRVGIYRAVFIVLEISEDPSEELYVEYIGPRGDAY